MFPHSTDQAALMKIIAIAVLSIIASQSFADCTVEQIDDFQSRGDHYREQEEYAAKAVNRNNSEGALGMNPAFNAEECTNCGMCMTVCPDPGAIVWKDKKMQGINPRFCKTCLRCVTICPRTGRALRDPSKDQKEKEPVAAGEKKQ